MITLCLHTFYLLTVNDCTLFFLSGPSVIIYECNWRCRCHKQKCGNRVIQKGIKVNMELYKDKDMGWGVRARQDISRGTFVCEYVTKSKIINLTKL